MDKKQKPFSTFFMGLLLIEALQSHSDTPYLVGLLWTSGQPFVETST